jgi:para-aminobenzoate synthetase/4-amino-4-deoxychorismate lyase
VADASAPLRVRLLLDRTGGARAEAHALGEMHPLRVCLAAAPIDSECPFYYHKTTQRDMYTDARAAYPDADDVLLWNERGEITESTIANVVVRFNDVWYTPPIHCGLLAGTLRARLLRDGAIHERVILRDELHRAGEIQLINSVRGWIPIKLSGIEEGNHAGRD